MSDPLTDTSSAAANAPNPNEEIVTVATFQSLIEADLVRTELEAAGIEAWVANATSTQTFVSMPEIGLQIQVAGSNAAAAKQIVDQLTSGTAVASGMVTDADVDAAASEADADAAESSDVAESDSVPDPEGVRRSAGEPTMYDDAEAGG